MKIKLLVNIDFEYGGIKKTRFKAGEVFVASPSKKFVDGVESDTLDGYWIGTSPFRTKCFSYECEIVES